MSGESILPPSPAGLFSEALGFLELPRLLLQSPVLASQPRGRGQCVLVFPGYGAGDGSTSVLRSYLRYLGYRPLGWGLGRNDGEVPDLLPRVVERLEEVALGEGKPVALVGWSLGGYLAREAARDRPDAALQVITLGSPVVGGPKYTAVADAYRRRGIDLDAIESEVAARNEQTLETPVTAIYSRRDGIVAWRACIDHHAPRVEHVEVATTHLGLGFSPEVFCILAARLARGPEPARRPQAGAMPRAERKPSSTTKENPMSKEPRVEALSQLLADSYTLYLKTHNFHWNVTGPMFTTLHTLFETHYTELALAVDEIAERIRAVGAPAPGSYAAFAARTKIQESESVPSAVEMVKALVSDHETVAHSAQLAFEAAQAVDDEVSADLAISRMQVHEKAAWMLRSHLE